jgi:hypothetical protein
MFLYFIDVYVDIKNIKLERPNRRPLSSLLSSARAETAEHRHGRERDVPRARVVPAENPPRPELVKPQTSAVKRHPAFLHVPARLQRSSGQIKSSQVTL